MVESTVFKQHTAEDIAAGLRAAGYRVKGQPGGRYRTSTAVCHGGDAEDQLTFRDMPDGGLQVKCWTAECREGLKRRVLQAAGLWVEWEKQEGERLPKDAWAKVGAHWAAAAVIDGSFGKDHPVRKWLANKAGWAADRDVPGNVRWRGAWYGHTGAGSLVVGLDEPCIVDWFDAPRAIQLVHVSGDGGKAKDAGGLDKRNYGASAGLSFYFGERDAPLVRVVEGLADGLAVYGKCGAGEAVLGVCGVGNLMRGMTPVFLRGRDVVVMLDNDVAGIKAAQELVLWLRDKGGRARAVLPAGGAKDVSDALAAGGGDSSAADAANSGAVDSSADATNSGAGDRNPGVPNSGDDGGIAGVCGICWAAPGLPENGGNCGGAGCNQDDSEGLDDAEFEAAQGEQAGAVGAGETEIDAAYETGAAEVREEREGIGGVDVGAYGAVRGVSREESDVCAGCGIALGEEELGGLCAGCNPKPYIPPAASSWALYQQRRRGSRPALPAVVLCVNAPGCDQQVVRWADPDGRCQVCYWREFEAAGWEKRQGMAGLAA